MQLFYNPVLKEGDSRFTFDSGESKHIAKVLRKNVGDELQITNGQGFFFDGKIIDNSSKNCVVEIYKTTKIFPTKHRLHMAVAPTKMNDRFEWFLEKATEIGIHEITPIICARSERKTVKQERMQRVVQAAMKQSFQAYLPKINDAITLDDFLEQTSSDLLFIAHCEKTERFELKRRIAPDNEITILIGPEGDFSPKEIKNAQSKGYLPISMGQTRLRTETAAIVACTIVRMINTA